MKVQPSLDDDVQLLVAARARAELVVLADHECAARFLVEGVHAERADAEFAAHVHAPAASVLRVGHGLDAEPALGRRRRGLLSEMTEYEVFVAAMCSPWVGLERQKRYFDLKLLEIER